MAAASDSNDASDIFWPGYVDAVTNLAINLLFVIAVMSIVVLSAVLQISKLKPEDFVPKSEQPVESRVSSSLSNSPTQDGKSAIVQSAKVVQSTLAELSKIAEKSNAQPSESSAETDKALKALLSTLNQNSKELAPGKLEKMLADKAAAEKLSSEQAQTIQQLQRDLQFLKTGQRQQRSPNGRDQDTGGTADMVGRADVVNATTRRDAPKAGASQLQFTSSAGGIVVVYDKDVVDLSDSEAASLIQKMAQIKPLKQGEWLIQVISPKGFSEATRLAYYRVNSVRNALLKNGVAPGAIDMRVVESQNDSANNARVLVRAIDAR